ncbi:hypothetical protein [Pseudomonas aeruginosa]|uniref:hypothetical protein n=1 Tax=Pseudomonas aeruginosa TaxID=287 RepID=UPI00287FD6CE|nr:hypothetical protein [Pseudomonas aeruginosa]
MRLSLQIGRGIAALAIAGLSVLAQAESGPFPARFEVLVLGTANDQEQVGLSLQASGQQLDDGRSSVLDVPVEGETLQQIQTSLPQLHLSQLADYQLAVSPARPAAVDFYYRTAESPDVRALAIKAKLLPPEADGVRALVKVATTAPGLSIQPLLMDVELTSDQVLVTSADRGKLIAIRPTSYTPATPTSSDAQSEPPPTSEEQPASANPEVWTFENPGVNPPQQPEN